MSSPFPVCLLLLGNAKIGAEEIHATTSGPFDALKCRRLFPFVSLARLLSLKVALFPPPILHLAVTSTKGASGIASPPPIIRLKVPQPNKCTKQKELKKKKKKSGTAHPLLRLLFICLKVPPTHPIDKKIRRKGKRKEKNQGMHAAASPPPIIRLKVPWTLKKSEKNQRLHLSTPPSPIIHFKVSITHKMDKKEEEKKIMK